MKLAPSNKPRTTTKNSKATSTATSCTFGLRLATATYHYLSNAWISVNGFLTALVQRTWSFFLSIPFASSTLSSEKASRSMPKITRSSGSTRSAPTPSSKKTTQNLRKSVTRYISPDLTVSVPMVPRSVNLSTGPTTTLKQKPRKRGAVLASSSPATGVASAARKQPAAPGQTTTQSSRAKSSKTQPSSVKKSSAKSSRKPKA